MYITVDVILFRMINIRPVCSGGNLAIHQAARVGDIPYIVSYLAKNGDVELRLTGGFTPLHFAAQSGNVNVVELLLLHGANVHAKTNFDYTPLHFAADKGDSKAVQLLLDAGAGVRARTVDGHTAEMLARHRNHFTLAEFLRRLVEEKALLPAKS